MMSEKKAIIIIDLKASDAAYVWLSSHAKELEDNIIIIIYQFALSRYTTAKRVM